MKKESPIRLIDAGTVPYLQSQTIYHALAYAKTSDSPDTVVLSHPGSRYVCVGFHQDPRQEVDLEYCKQENIPVIRRETGGGTVLIDPDQLFVQWIFHPENLPRKIDARFRLFVKPLIDTYQFFGINAYEFPPNDVHVNGRKIVGTGAAAIGNAEVVTGNFLLDFDSASMARIINAPGPEFRNLFRQSLESYLTSMKKELGKIPPQEKIAKVYLEKCRAALGRDLEPGTFTAEELDWMTRLDKKFSSEKWLLDNRKTHSPERIVKVHAGVWIGETSHPANGREIRTLMRTKGNRIDHISLSGDFEINPSYRLKGLENALRNVEMEEENLRELLEAFFELHDAETPGIPVKDWVKAVLKMKTIKQKLSGG